MDVSPKTTILLSEVPQSPGSDSVALKNEAIIDFAEITNNSTIRHQTFGERYWEEDSKNITYQGASEIAKNFKKDINMVLKGLGMNFYFLYFFHLLIVCFNQSLDIFIA